MIDSFLFSANIVLPSFVMILLGKLIVLKRVVTREWMDKLAKISFVYLMSTRIFLDVANSDPEAFSNYAMVIYCNGMVVILVLVIWAISLRVLKNKQSVGAFTQACFRGSFSVIGLSIIDSFAGAEGVARCALLLAASAVVVNIMACLVLSRRDIDRSLRDQVYIMVKTIVTNPFIIAGVLGLIVSLSRIKFPYIIERSLNYIGTMAVPASLLCIGSGLNFRQSKSSIKYATIASVIKTFGISCITIPIAVLLGFRGFELSVIAIFFCSANPSANYVMALDSGNDSELAATGIVFSTLLCIFSNIIFLTGLQVLNLM